MTKLIMWNLLSLDGYFEGAKSWDLDFHQSVWGDELERLSLEQLSSADGLLFGRITYEGMAAYWQTATGEIADLMNRLPKVVVWTNTRTRQLDQHKIDQGRRRRRNKKTQATRQRKHIRLRQRQPLRNFAGAGSLRRVPSRYRSRLARLRQAALPPKFKSPQPQTSRFPQLV